MTSLRQGLVRLRSAKVTAKPSKCMTGFGSIKCLGHNIVGQSIRPKEEQAQGFSDAVKPVHHHSAGYILFPLGSLSPSSLF